MRTVELRYEGNNTGIRNNEIYCMGEQRECDRTQSLCHKEEAWSSWSREAGKGDVQQYRGWRAKAQGMWNTFACKDVLHLPQFLFVVGAHDSHISFCLFLGDFSLYNMLNLKHLENQQRQKYHHCHGSNWVERNVKDRLQNQQDMFSGFLSERCFDQVLVWTWKIGV